MSLIVVSGDGAGAGATTVAVGLAARLAAAGHSVRVERMGGDGRADGDAAVFGALDFAASTGRPLDEPPAGGDGVTVLEAPASVAAGAGARLVAVRLEGGEGGEVEGAAVTVTNRVSRPGPLCVPEDRLLAAPTVGALAEATGASVLARSREGDGALCEHLVIGPISESPDEPHFKRFASKAVITRSGRVDVALAALRADAGCLILTGGSDPSPYVLDFVASRGTTTLLLAPGDTVQTVHQLEGTFGREPFSGQAKVERAAELVGAALDEATLAALT